MERSTVDYIIASFFLHAMVILAIVYTSPAKSGGADKIEVNIVQKQKSRPAAPILSTSRKYAKHGPGEGAKGKDEKIDLTEYANQLKAIVDPIWVSKLKNFRSTKNTFLATEVLIFPDKYGNIVSVRVVKSSGSPAFDKLALDAVREARQIPKPSDLLVKEGIIWEFSTGERSQ